MLLDLINLIKVIPIVMIINLQLDVREVVEIILIALKARLQCRVGALVARVVHRVQLGKCC